MSLDHPSRDDFGRIIWRCEAFLTEFLVNRFADPQSGDAEPFLFGFTFKDREPAERLAEWIRGPRSAP
jgi:hypothetical protein